MGSSSAESASASPPSRTGARVQCAIPSSRMRRAHALAHAGVRKDRGASPRSLTFPLKIDLAARADRIEHRRERIGDTVELVSSQDGAGAPALDEPRRLDAAEPHFQNEVEAAALLAERKPRRREQGLGRRGLEDPTDALLRLNDRNC